MIMKMGKINFLPLALLISCIGVFVQSYDMEAGEINCPTGDSKWLEIKHVPWGIPNRAALTVPRGVQLATSKIPGAGTGAFATTFIPRNTWLGEFEGEIRRRCSGIYAWDNDRNSKRQYYIDGEDERTANWLRWLNCPRHFKEQNVIPLQCRGKFFYVTLTAVYPGQELQVYYGDEYAEDILDIDVKSYYNMDIDLKVFDRYACWNTTRP